MKSVMRHQFSEVASVEIPRSTFDRSHGVKSSFDGGYIVPFMVDEALPGDTFSVNVTGFARLSTPIYPIMDNMRMETFFFAVPMRLIWEHWDEFCGSKKHGNPEAEYEIPIFDTSDSANKNFLEHSLADYFGLPTKLAAPYEFSCLPFRAYNLIWNEWFMDQNLQEPVTVETGDGPDSMDDYELLRRGKRHDYFTSCLPWLQRGDSVTLSLGSTAPVFGTGKAVNLWDGSTVKGLFAKSDNNLIASEAAAGLNAGQSPTPLVMAQSEVVGLQPNLGTGQLSGVYTDLAGATASTVNELRQAIQVQRILERDARSGVRYTEIIQSHFGVISPDARLQRPEYLGGGSTPVNVTPIARTDSSPGKLGAMGTSGFSGHGFTKSFTEHCIIIGLVNVRADLTYQQGLDRMWSRQTRFDYYWPSLAHLGEQAVLKRELECTATATDDDVFGYQERYAEYRYKPSKITGLFRSNATGSLDAWHLSQDFNGTTPDLNDEFIKDNPPIDRVIAVPSEPHFIFDSYIQMRCTRPMPVYSIPGLIDHF